MAQYYYDKYNVLITNTYTAGSWINDYSYYALGTANWNSAILSSLSPSYVIGSEQGYSYHVTGTSYTLSNNGATNADAGATLGIVGYRPIGINSGVLRYTVQSGGIKVDRLERQVQYTTYSRGSLVQSNIAAAEGAYPANEKHTDGYWYVKGSVVGSLPPGTVINQPYSTAENGGRKLVRLSNGWQVSVVRESPDGVSSVNGILRWYISKNEGVTWEPIHYTDKYIMIGVAMATYGDNVYTITNNSRGTLLLYKFNGATATNTLLSHLSKNTGDNVAGEISLAVDSLNGHLHVAWSGKSTSYPNSFNIRYAKSTDGGGTWSAVEEVVKDNSLGNGNDSPSIIVRNGKPSILCVFQNSSSNNRSIMLLTKEFITDSVYGNGKLNTSWGAKLVLNNGSYPQTLPSAVVDKDGAIHVAWQGKDVKDKINYGIMYSKSIDGGISWSEPLMLAYGKLNESIEPSITVDKQGVIVILCAGRDNAFSTTSNNVYKLVFNGSWSNPIRLTSVNAVGKDAWKPSALYDINFTGRFGDTPPTIYSTDSSVEYMGSYITNTTPTISGVDANLGDRSAPFTQSYSVNDDNATDSLTVTEKLNGVVLRSISNVPRNTVQTIDIKSALFAPLALNSTNKIQIEVNDGVGGIAYRNYTFTKSNSAPIISGIDADLGVITAIPSEVYQVSDNEGDAITITEKIDDIVIRTFESTPGTDYTITIPELEWFKLNLGQHILQVEALDSRGGKSIRTYTFTRADDKIKIELKTPFVTDMKASKLLISPTWVIPTGATAKVEACNNAYDDIPTWEDITNQVLINRHYNFTNVVKTAEKWGINIRFTLEKGTATNQVILDGFGGAFE